MTNFQAAVCPSCGGQLQVPDDRDTVKCMYCGVDIVVRQAIQATSGINIENYFELALNAFKSGNNQEAYKYYSKILEVDLKNAKAWFGKGRSAGWLSTLADFRFSEMISCFENGYNYLSENQKQGYNQSVADEIVKIGEACYRLAKEHLDKFRNNDDVWTDYINQSDKIMRLFEYAEKLTPNNPRIMENIISICKDNLEGVTYEYWSDFSKSNSIGVRSVSIEYRKTLTEKMNDYTEKLKQLNPNYEQPKIKKKYSTNQQMAICCVIIFVIIVIFVIVTQ